MLKTQEFDVIDTLYRLLVDRKYKRVGSSLMVNEDNTFEYQKKAELLKGKIDFLYDNNHFDVIDKINGVIGELLPDDEEVEMAQ